MAEMPAVTALPRCMIWVLESTVSVTPPADWSRVMLLESILATEPVTVRRLASSLAPAVGSFCALPGAPGELVPFGLPLLIEATPLELKLGLEVPLVGELGLAAALPSLEVPLFGE